ncbi:AraC family transcriptional regulator [Paenibacillus sp. 1781tsa1]|uniref:helix-turn-helix domain-containing protein n=1 Tax=Paenibacillus sp. 1781tsa1 TaxID=2953810 RepID=UPI0020A17206|nr:AraC family transcriptional regulator [Paenibacillus sp. 1781tsa1]MCP1185193.1 AraC family transcriptional regulator [Paenibacillus sp. 1781tsa1]
MTWNLYSMMPKMIMAPGYSETVCTEPNRILVAFTEQSFETRYRDTSYYISSRDLLVGNDLILLNRLSVPVVISVLTLENMTKMRFGFPMVLSRQDDGVKLFVKCLLEMFGQSTFKPEYSKQLSLEFTRFFNMYRMMNQSTDNLKGKIDNRLIIVHRMIRSQYSEPLTLEDMAARISCNPVYLSNTYKKVFGCSPIKSLQKIRVQKGRELLKHTDLTINEITKSVGYISSSQFSGYYKKYYGRSPSEYRKHLCNKTGEGISDGTSI